MADPEVEVIHLGEFDPVANRREFDAVSYAAYYWRGLLSWEMDGPGGSPTVYIWSDREDPFSDDYAGKKGTLEHVRDDDLAKDIIKGAVAKCFDHTSTFRAISDGKGGWIPLITDN